MIKQQRMLISRDYGFQNVILSVDIDVSKVGFKYLRAWYAYKIWKDSHWNLSIRTETGVPNDFLTWNATEHIPREEGCFIGWIPFDSGGSLPDLRGCPRIKLSY